MYGNVWVGRKMCRLEGKCVEMCLAQTETETLASTMGV